MVAIEHLKVKPIAATVVAGHSLHCAAAGWQWFSERSGVTAWRAKADCVLIPVLILCVGLAGFSLYRMRLRGG
jgi:hypothetical protein